MQPDLFSLNDFEVSEIPQALVDLIALNATFLSTEQQSQLWPYLTEQLQWQQPELTVFGQSHKIPRLQTWMGDTGLEYAYSGKRFVAEGWSKPMWWLKQKVEQATGFAFNSCLLNRYRGGEDKMGWHADDEEELGQDPAVAIVSLGATRDIQFRLGKKGQSHNLALSSGSCLLMKPGCQSKLQHQIPARKKVDSERISLTYRYIHFN